MSRDDEDIRRSLQEAREAVDAAFTAWSEMSQPESVTLRERIAYGYEWLKAHPSEDDQRGGKKKIAILRAQACDAEIIERATPELNHLRTVYDIRAKRFKDDEEAYMRVLRVARARGIEDGE